MVHQRGPAEAAARQLGVAQARQSLMEPTADTPISPALQPTPKPRAGGAQTTQATAAARWPGGGFLRVVNRSVDAVGAGAG
jgi:hypothetical protein